MSKNQDRDERPCLHCMIMDSLEDFFAEYPAPDGEPDTIDTDEVISALAKTVAELTCRQNGANRQQIIEKLMREIMDRLCSAALNASREPFVSLDSSLTPRPAPTFPRCTCTNGILCRLSDPTLMAKLCLISMPS